MKGSEVKCCLTLDEMALKPKLDFDPSSGCVLGHADLPGCHGVANQAYVFMLGGIHLRNWHAYCYYLFTICLLFTICYYLIVTICFSIDHAWFMTGGLQIT